MPAEVDWVYPLNLTDLAKLTCSDLLNVALGYSACWTAQHSSAGFKQTQHSETSRETDTQIYRQRIKDRQVAALWGDREQRSPSAETPASVTTGNTQEMMHGQWGPTGSKHSARWKCYGYKILTQNLPGFYELNISVRTYSETNDGWRTSITSKCIIGKTDNQQHLPATTFFESCLICPQNNNNEKIISPIQKYASTDSKEKPLISFQRQPYW